MKQLILLLCLVLTCTAASATHIMGGFITFTKDTSPNPNPRKFLFKFTLITDRESMAHDPVVEIEMGNGVKVTVPWDSYTPINNKIVRSEYLWNYTFPSEGNFTVSWKGINRNPGMLNIAPPSDQITIYINTTVIVNSLRGPNSSPQFLAPESISTTVGKRLNFNLLAYDPDGDSLSYKLYMPLYKDQEGKVQAVPGYTFPNETFACNSTTGNGAAIFRLSPRDGQITWDAPCKAGEYTIMVLVEEWQGKTGKVKLSETMYDMNINVTGENASNITLANKNELEINSSGYIEIKANQPLELKINYTQLEQAMAPLPATYDQQTVTEYFASELSQVLKLPVTYTFEKTANGVIGTFRFTPTEELVRNRPYFVSFYGIKETYFTTASFGIVIRDHGPKLSLIETQELSYSAEKHILIMPEEPTTIKVLADDYPDYLVTLNAESTLAEGASKFTFSTQQTPEGTIGSLVIQPDKSQISSVPKTINFKAIYNPTTEGGTPITKELQVQVIVIPKSLIPYLAKNKSKRHFIFPNKVLDKFTVQTDTPTLLSIYSLQGKLILEKQLQPGDTEILKPNTIPGLYFYTLTTPDGEKITGKLVLQ